MTNEEKIDLLIQAKTKENNYLAMRFMLDILKLTFKDAFLKLELCEIAPARFDIEIADIRIHYDVHFFKQIDVPADWAEIKRHIFYKGQELEKYFNDIYVDEGYIWSMDEDDKTEDMEDLRWDIKEIAPIVEELFNDMEKNN